MKAERFRRKAVRIGGWAAAGVGLAASLVAVIGLFTAKLPVHRFELACNALVETDENGDPYPADLEKARNEIQNFIEFAGRMRGRVVYLEFKLESSAHAKFCRLEDEPSFALEVEREEDGAGEGWLAVFAPDVGGRYYVHFPDPATIPLDGVFTTWEEYYYYAVTGPFVLQYDSGNGHRDALFYPAAGNDSYFKEATCARRAADLPAAIRPFLPCF